MKNNYCPICGTKLNLKIIGDEGLVPYCDNCKSARFNYSYPCVLLIVKVNEKYAVIKQSYGIDRFVTVAGFIKYQDNVEKTIISEVKEELGLDVLDFKYIKSYYHESKDNLMLGFFVHAKEGKLKLSNELKEAHLVSKDEALEMLKGATLAHDLFINCMNLD